MVGIRRRFRSLTSLTEKRLKMATKMIDQGRTVAFQTSEISFPWDLFTDIERRIAELRPPSVI